MFNAAAAFNQNLASWNTASVSRMYVRWNLNLLRAISVPSRLSSPGWSGLQHCSSRLGASARRLGLGRTERDCTLTQRAACQGS